MLLRQACDEFLVHCRVAKNLSPHSLRAYAIDLEEFQRFFGPARRVGEVDRNGLRGYLRHLFDVRKLKETSIKRRLACLKVLFRWLEQEDVVPITPFHRFDGRLKLPQRLPRGLTRGRRCAGCWTTPRRGPAFPRPGVMRGRPWSAWLPAPPPPAVSPPCRG